MGEDSWWTIPVASLVNVVLAALVLSCVQTHTHTHTHTQTRMNALLPRLWSAWIKMQLTPDWDDDSDADEVLILTLTTLLQVSRSWRRGRTTSTCRSAARRTSTVGQTAIHARKSSGIATGKCPSVPVSLFFFYLLLFTCSLQFLHDLVLLTLVTCSF